MELAFFLLFMLAKALMLSLGPSSLLPLCVPSTSTCHLAVTVPLPIGAMLLLGDATSPPPCTDHPRQPAFLRATTLVLAAAAVPSGTRFSTRAAAGSCHRPRPRDTVQARLALP